MIFLLLDKESNPKPNSTCALVPGGQGLEWQIQSSGEESNVSSECHVRMLPDSHNIFSPLGSKPRFLYEILEFLTVGNKCFLYTVQARGATRTCLGAVRLTGDCFLTPVHLLSLKLPGIISSLFRVKSTVPDLKEGSACTRGGPGGL